MKQDIRSFFKLGILQWMSYPRMEETESLRLICEDDFFEAVELKGYGHRTGEAAALLKQSHLQVSYAAQPQMLAGSLNPNAVDEQERLRCEEALLKMLGEAEALGASGFSFLTGKWNGQTRDEALRQLLKTTDTICTAAAAKGIFAEVEVFDYDVDKCSLIGPAPLAAEYAKQVREKHSNFGLIVDLSHIPISHETSEFTVHTLRDYISHFHYGNCVMIPGADAYGDKHPRFGYPNSENDIPELVNYLRVLRREGFFRPEAPYVLSMEVTPRPGENEQILVANTKRVLTRAWAMLEEE